MAVKHLLEVRANKKLEAQKLKELEREAAKELVSPFIEDLRGPPGQDGAPGKDGLDGRPGKDADSTVLQIIQQRLDSLEEEEKSFQSKEQKKRTFEFDIQYHSNGLIKKVIAQEV